MSSPGVFEESEASNSRFGGFWYSLLIYGRDSRKWDSVPLSLAFGSVSDLVGTFVFICMVTFEENVTPPKIL